MLKTGQLEEGIYYIIGSYTRKINACGQFELSVGRRDFGRREVGESGIYSADKLKIKYLDLDLV
jgi:hypothetical protein